MNKRTFINLHRAAAMPLNCHLSPRPKNFPTGRQHRIQHRQRRDRDSQLGARFRPQHAGFRRSAPGTASIASQIALQQLLTRISAHKPRRSNPRLAPSPSVPAFATARLHQCGKERFRAAQSRLLAAHFRRWRYHHRHARSGVETGNLSTVVTALEIVKAAGDVVKLSRKANPIFSPELWSASARSAYYKRYAQYPADYQCSDRLETFPSTRSKATLNEVLSAAVPSWRGSSAFDLRLPPRDPLPVRVDRVEIEQVILNLMQNALDSVAEVRRHGQISGGRSDCTRPGRRELARASVEDSGAGISERWQDGCSSPSTPRRRVASGWPAIARTIVEPIAAGYGSSGAHGTGGRLQVHAALHTAPEGRKGGDGRAHRVRRRR